jgi:cytochrome c oxidase subunit II
VATGRAFLISAVSLSLAACSGRQSSLDPQGPYAQQIANLFWAFLAVCALIWLAVCVVLSIAVIRRRAARPQPLELAPARERMMGQLVLSLGGGTGVIVIAFALISYVAQRNLWAEPNSGMTLRVVGHQWWWEVLYDDPQPARNFITANEIHIPVNTLVRVRLETRDVIHSFWVPSLAGKMDQISGHINEQLLLAARPGIYRGQCAEFCGQEHAKMAFSVVASSPEEFDAWRDGQIRAAAPPEGPERRRGRHVFESHSCLVCHTIRGTIAGGKFGPDLTHLASRRSIAAGTAPLTAGHLGGWIADPQHLKPGTQMPPGDLGGADLSALVAYLMGLQ